ncbi:hypothetical protein Tco_0853225 [Tanacetum coccineum]
MNEDYYHEQNSCYDPNSFGFDQFQPLQYTVNHPIFNAQNSLLNSQNEFLNSQNKLMEQMTSMCDMVGQFIQKKEEEKRIEEEQAAKDRYWKIPVCYNNDDNEESSIPLKDIIIVGLPPCVAITPVLFTKEPVDSLIMEDEHLDTIPETESDELIKSSVEDLVQIPSESEDSSEGECDLPPYDDSSKNHDLTFSNPLFDIDEDFTSSDESFSEEDVPNENFKIFSNPLFDLDEEITSTKVDQIDDEVLENTNSIPPGIEYPCFNAESDLLESLLHRDTSINDSQKIDSLLDEFAGELTLHFSHVMVDFYENIRLGDASTSDYEIVSLEWLGLLSRKLEGLILIIEALKDNPTPSSDFVTKSSSTSPNFFLEETNTFDNSLPESETFCFNLEEKSSGSTTILSDYSLPDYEAFYLNDDHIEEKSSGSTTTHADFSQYDSFIFDLSINPFPPVDRSDFYHEEFAGELAHIISPSEYDHFYFKIEPDSGNFTMDVVEDIFDNPTREPRVHVPNVLPTHPTLHLDSDFTISSDSLGSDLVVSFPSGTRNKIFDPGIFIRVQSKRFLSPNEFSISFMRDPLSPVFNTLLPFLSENEDKVFNPGILASNEETSPHLSSHRGLKALNESPMMISGGDTPILDVLIARIVKNSRASIFIKSFTSSASFWESRYGYSRKRAKRKPKASNSKHGVERAKSKVRQSKKIQLEGLKLPKPQVVLQKKKKTRVKIAKKAKIAFKLYNLRGPKLPTSLKAFFPAQQTQLQLELRPERRNRLRAIPTPPLTCAFIFLRATVNDQSEEGPTDFALMAYSSTSSNSEANKAKPKAVRNNNGALIIEEWVYDNEEDDVPQAKIEKKKINPSFAKIEFVKPKQQEKTARKTSIHVEQNRQNIYTPRGNQRNWNNMMSQRLGSNFEMFNKACYVCESFDHLVNHQSFTKKTYPCAKKNIVPRAVLMKSGLVSVNTVRQVNVAHTKTTVNAARPMSYLSKTAHSTVKKPIHKNTSFKNSNFNQSVNTVKDKNVNTVRPKATVNAAKPKAVFNAVKENNVNAVKASAY